jgi:CYTH domain-containing protein
MPKVEVPTLRIGKEKIVLSEKVPEVEDKYIIARPSEKFLDLATTSEIIQGYLVNGVRVLKEIFQDGTILYSGVFKDRKNERRRDEYTAILTKSQFKELWKKVEAHLTKTRHKILIGGYQLDIDEFHGPLEGKWMAEVEGENEEALDTFEQNPPSVFRSEFGHLKRLSNGQRKNYTSRMLAYKGWPQEEELAS